MTVNFPRCISIVVWLLIPVVALTLYFLPVSNRFTKVCVLGVAALAWRGVFSLAWPHRRLRWILPGITLAGAIFLLLPGRATPPVEVLRADYTSALRSYEGSPYYWGGESRRGIDCSGLIRCGMMNALLRRGLLSANPALIRQSLSLWWNDTSADALGKEHAGLTRRMFDAPSINETDHSRLQPGDIAVTPNGIHILAYLGNGTWTQADPGPGRVVSAPVPGTSGWYKYPVKLLRWTVLAGE